MTKEQIAENLRKILIECLCGPGGDPDRSHTYAAAIAYVTLEDMGMLTEKDKEWERNLTGGNSSDENFLKYVRSGGD